MAVSRLSTQSIQQSFPKGNSIWDGSTAVGSMDAITGVSLASAQSKIEFNNIPQTYTHLQIRSFFRNSSSSGGGAEENIRMTFNNDINANYSSHAFISNGSSFSAWAFDTDNDNDLLQSYGLMPMSNVTANIYGSSVVDIVNYANTNTTKTIKGIGGADKNGSTASYMNLWSGNWRSTSAITSIQIFTQAGSFTTNSAFTLYGIK